MSRDAKIMLAGIVTLILIGIILLLNQIVLRREQQKLEREIQRSPFFEPESVATNQPTP